MKKEYERPSVEWLAFEVAENVAGDQISFGEDDRPPIPGT